jgi:chromosome segregation ATPase
LIEQLEISQAQYNLQKEANAALIEQSQTFDDNLNNIKKELQKTEQLKLEVERENESLDLQISTLTEELAELKKNIDQTKLNHDLNHTVIELNNHSEQKSNLLSEQNRLKKLNEDLSNKLTECEQKCSNLEINKLEFEAYKKKADQEKIDFQLKIDQTNKMNQDELNK